MTRYLVKNQKECPFCHEPFKEISDNGLFESTLVYEDGEWFATVSEYSNEWGTFEYYSGGFKLDFCPMCGRKLVKNDN